MTATPTTPGKKDFSELYTSPDPRPYMRYFATQDYRVLAAGGELYRRVVDAMGDPGSLVDVCASYGQDAAVLNHHLSGQELFDHYTADVAASLSRDELAARDRDFYATRRRSSALPVLGLDASAPAVGYGVDAGLLSAAVAGDVEADPAVDLSPFRDAGGVVVTGGVGYVGPLTFSRLLDSTAGRPWVAGLVLRWVDLTPLADELRSRGYRVQVAEDAPVVQRRVADDQERTAMLDRLRELGRAVGPVESGGHHAALPFLAVPDGGPTPDLDALVRGLEAVR
ncbi:hypothetical protein [Aquipuribacter sp. MA13-6]|uniref:hypothetical protein n=1 Tax=unclassified Aquipuribacter TaxID=2635084 RepID=UPI003EEC6E97